MKYIEAPDVKERVCEIIEKLNLTYIRPQRIYCYRSRGSKSRRIIARIHGLEKLWQQALMQPPAYGIEVLSEKFDMMSIEEQEKTLIHELLHIPKGFKGGFIPHKGHITRKRVEQLHQALLAKRAKRFR